MPARPRITTRCRDCDDPLPTAYLLNGALFCDFCQSWADMQAASARGDESFDSGWHAL